MARCVMVGGPCDGCETDCEKPVIVYPVPKGDYIEKFREGLIAYRIENGYPEAYEFDVKKNIWVRYVPFRSATYRKCERTGLYRFVEADDAQTRVPEGDRVGLAGAEDAAG